MKFQLILLGLVIGLNTYADTKCIAHRGYHNDYPDNSLSAFIAAQDVKADGIELDIVHTKDGIALVNHDKNLKKTGTDLAGEHCPTSIRIKFLTLDEIKAKCTLRNGEMIPTLEEALQVITLTDQMLFLELKDTPTEKTAKIVEKYYKASPEKLRVISFKKKNIRTLFNSNKNAKSFWNKVKAQKLTVKPWPLSRFFDVNVFMAAYKARRKFFRRTNKEIGVWTVNSEANLNLLMNDRVDFITTDNLETCLELKK